MTLAAHAPLRYPERDSTLGTTGPGGAHMITQIDKTNLSRIKNRELQVQAARYLQIHDGFMEQIRHPGIEIDDHDYGDGTRARLDRLRRRGARCRPGAMPATAKRAALTVWNSTSITLRRCAGWTSRSAFRRAWSKRGPTAIICANCNWI